MEDGPVYEVKAFGKVEIAAHQGPGRGLSPPDLDSDFEPLLVRGGARPVGVPPHDSFELRPAPDAVDYGEHPEASLGERSVSLPFRDQGDLPPRYRFGPPSFVPDDLVELLEPW